MKYNRTCLIGFLLGLLMALAACAAPGQGRYPEGFQLYYDLIGEKKEVVLSRLGLNESDLSDAPGGLLLTPKAVRYQDLTFEVQLEFDRTAGTLLAVHYLKGWQGERETAIQGLVSLSQGLTDLFGPAQTLPGYENPTRVTKLSAQELDKAFAEKPKRWSVTDYWILEEERNGFDCMLELQVVAVDADDTVAVGLRLSPNMY